MLTNYFYLKAYSDDADMKIKLIFAGKEAVMTYLTSINSTKVLWKIRLISEAVGGEINYFMDVFGHGLEL